MSWSSNLQQGLYFPYCLKRSAFKIMFSLAGSLLYSTKVTYHHQAISLMILKYNPSSWLMRGFDRLISSLTYKNTTERCLVGMNQLRYHRFKEAHADISLTFFLPVGGLPIHCTGVLPISRCPLNSSTPFWSAGAFTILRHPCDRQTPFELLRRWNVNQEDARGWKCDGESRRHEVTHELKEWL